MRHVGDALLKYGKFSGTASRPQYWWFLTFNLGGSLLLAACTYLTESDFLAFLESFWGYAFFLPGLAVTVRRLHGTGRSGWWALIAFTVVGIPVLLYWLASKR